MGDMVCIAHGFSKEKRMRTRSDAIAAAERNSLSLLEYHIHLHVKRANYQALPWKKALERDPKISYPEGHGWELADEKFKVCSMENKLFLWKSFNNYLFVTAR